MFSYHLIVGFGLLSESSYDLIVTIDAIVKIGHTGIIITLGTEVLNLSPDLEAHYRKYFTDRSAIVLLSEKYERVFTALRTKAKNLNAQLGERKLALERLAEQVQQQATSIDSERSNLQSSGTSNSQSDYNSRVSNFNDRVNGYNQIVARLREQTETYNQMVTEHNSIALEEKSLVESLENK